MKYLLSIIYIICTTCGITFFKLGGDSFKLAFSNGFKFEMGWLTFFGFIFYAISFLLWQRLLIKFDLSVMVPIITGISQIIIIIVGYLIFNEKSSLQSIIGALIIIIGIIVISFPKK